MSVENNILFTTCNLSTIKKELVKCSGKTKTVIDSDRLMTSSEEESTGGECVNSKYYVKLCIIFFMVDITITCIIYDTCQNAISRCLRGRTTVELMGHFNDLDLRRQHVILIYYTILANYNIHMTTV